MAPSLGPSNPSLIPSCVPQRSAVRPSRPTRFSPEKREEMATTYIYFFSPYFGAWAAGRSSGLGDLGARGAQEGLAARGEFALAELALGDQDAEAAPELAHDEGLPGRHDG